MPTSPEIDAVELSTKEKYSGKVYHADAICQLPATQSRLYFDVLLNIKIDMVRRCAKQANVLDLCCGAGVHLLILAPDIKYGIGLDFSHPFLIQANTKKVVDNITNIAFIEGNARRIPLQDSFFDLVYCFSSLYHIPNVGQVVSEISRVLKPQGVCILEFGNLHSLNTIVCNAYPELAHPCHIPVREMQRLLCEAKLSTIKHKAFQILPLWGNRPTWLKPLLHPVWKRILQKQIKGKMLDEWISELPVLSYFAFRHIFICEKIR